MNDSAHEFDHERSDVAPKWPILIGASVLLLLPLTIGLISLLVHTIWVPEPSPDAAPAVTEPARLTGAPKLQTQPQADLARLEQQWDERLHSVGWVDRAAGIVHVPIEQAKQRLIAQGLDRETRQPPPSRAGNDTSARESAAGATMANDVGATERAGDASERVPRNTPGAEQAVPYRDQEMRR